MIEATALCDAEGVQPRGFVEVYAGRAAGSIPQHVVLEMNEGGNAATGAVYLTRLEATALAGAILESLDAIPGGGTRADPDQ